MGDYIIKQLSECNDTNARITKYNEILSLSSSVIADNIDTIINQYNDDVNNDEESLLLKILVNATSSSSSSSTTETIGKKVYKIMITRLKLQSLSLSIKSLQWKVLLNLSSESSLLSLISNENNILLLIKDNTYDINCLELAWKLSKTDDYDTTMASSELQLIKQFIITINNINTSNDIKIMIIKIIGNISLNKSNQPYLASAELGLLQSFISIINNDKGDTVPKVLGIIHTLSRHKKVQQYMSSKDLGLIVTIVSILCNPTTPSTETIDITLKIVINLSVNESNNEYMISNNVGLVTALKGIIMKSDKDASVKAWTAVLNLLPDIESRVPFLSDVIKDDKNDARLKALDEVQGLAKEKEYHQAMIGSALGLFKALSHAMSDKGDARSRALIIARSLTKTTKTKANLDANFKAILLSIIKDNNENDSKSALLILSSTAATKEDKLAIALLKLRNEVAPDELKAICKELLQLTVDNVKISNLDDIGIILSKYTSSIDEEQEVLLLSILANISKSQDTQFQENLFGKMFAMLVDRLTKASAALKSIIWRIMNNLADSNTNKKAVGNTQYGLFPIIVSNLRDDNDVDCLSFALNLCRNVENRKELGAVQLGLCPILIDKMKHGYCSSLLIVIFIKSYHYLY